MHCFSTGKGQRVHSFSLCSSDYYSRMNFSTESQRVRDTVLTLSHLRSVLLSTGDVFSFKKIQRVYWVLVHTYSKVDLSNLESQCALKVAPSGHHCNRKRQYRIKIVLNCPQERNK